jgi:PPK2 family polyphosphate:nucleotide phosphotransferase
MRKARVRQLVEPYLVNHGAGFRLKRIDPEASAGIEPWKPEAEALLKDGVERLRSLQDKLYAQDCWGVLLIFQAMDGAGKDSAIKHVMSGVNPQGCQVHSFKQPSIEELDHDFMWRHVVKLPERGRIGIFNRSYYEEVLVVRVHSELLQGEKIPEPLVTKRIWQQRFDDINAFERYLARNGYVIRKFFLHISPDEQLRRFRKRLEEPEKNWKFSLGDLHEHEHWEDYMAAYEDAIRHTATPHAPWVVVPGNQKWFARLVVAAAIVQALEERELDYPRLGPQKRREIEEGRAKLERLVRARKRSSVRKDRREQK